ncbi:hypothetical protein JTB14_024198 [Gonioctena quinquepunctata]|nr:hypothetical protein JTB14_024198 [Gonioctena quinquepunctata]
MKFKYEFEKSQEAKLSLTNGLGFASSHRELISRGIFYIKNDFPDHRMYHTLKFLIVIIGFSLSQAFLRDEDVGEVLLPLTKIWHDKCTLITDIPQASIDAVKNGIFDDGDVKIKKYILCLWLVSGDMTTDLNLNIENMTKLMPKKIENGIQTYQNCNQEAKKSDAVAHEKIWCMMKCIHKVKPETFLMF